MPHGKWTDDYKLYLCQLCQDNVIKSFQENHSTNSVHFTLFPTTNSWLMPYTDMATLTSNPDAMDMLLKTLKLKSSINLSNMNAFDANGKLKKYNTPYEVIDDHFPVRMNGR